MTNPDHATIKLTMFRNNQSLGIGSGVLYERAGKHYIVTAWHNVTGRNSETLKCLNKSTLATPDSAIASIVCKLFDSSGHGGYTRMSIRVPLEVDGKATYYVHPQGWPRVDVVAIPFDPRSNCVHEYEDLSGRRIDAPAPLIADGLHGSLSRDIEPIQHAEEGVPDFGFDLSKQLFVSDDVFVLGYPKGITDQTGQPVWKRGTVASDPNQGWNGEKMFLIDCASKEGMSGAPVILYNRSGSLRVGGMKYFSNKPLTILHGIYVGRVGSTTEFEAQVGRVWKRSVIDKIIDSAMTDPISCEIAVSNQAILEVIEDLWPKVEGEISYGERILDGRGKYASRFVHNVMKSLNGRANPEDVRALVEEFARSSKNTRS